jgi:hypothetical protein
MCAKTVFLSLVFASLTGCTNRSPRSDWESTLQRSALFQQVQKRASHPGWIIDSESQKEIILAVGDNTPGRFDRWFTVKVLKPSGEMLQLKRGDSGEDLWMPLASTFER